VETEFAVERVRARVPSQPDAAAVEYPRPIRLLLLTGFACLQAAWLLALALFAFWLA
jgi:hypothetical protein